jgi:hypothetical protein
MEVSRRHPFRSRSLVAICTLSMVLSGLPIALLHAPPAVGQDSPASAYAPWFDLGWKYRKPVTIDNTAGPSALKDYQLMIPLNTQELISAGKMRSDCGDARFTDSDGTTELNYSMEDKSNFWVRVPNIPSGSTTVIYFYYGNLTASSASNATNTFDLFEDFENYTDGTNIPNWQEVAGDWILTTPSGKNRAVRLDDTGSSSALVRSSTVRGARIIEADLADETLTNNNPHPGIVVGYQDANNYNAIYWRSQTAQLVRWQVVGGTETGTDINLANSLVGAVANMYHRMKVSVDASGNVVNVNFLNYNTTPGFSVQTTGAGLWQHRSITDIGWCDNFRVRKYASPEPTLRPSAEELPFEFKSFAYSPPRMNDGDTVFFNASFNNPTTELIRIQLAAREADDFDSTTDYFYQDNVQLAPSADITVPFTWTAVGGPRTIWLAISDHPIASVKIRVNRDPVIAPVKDQSLWQDRDFALIINASDPDGDLLTWSIDNHLFNISSVSNRSAEISFLPTNDHVGMHRANVTVADPMNRSDTRRINFTVNNVNDPPALTKIPLLSATQYKELRYQARADDPDLKWGDLLTFSDNTDLFDIDARTGEFFFTPVEEQVGKHNIKITVADKEEASAQASFTITVDNVNDPPTLEILPPQFALQGRLFQLKVLAADPDLKSDPTEKLRYSDDSSLFIINNDTGQISFTPTNDQIGVWPANITVTDKGGLSSTTALTITVMNANDPPSIEAILAQTATEGVPFQYQSSATDPDLKWGLDNLTFNDDTDLFNIDPMTGTISFTPTGAQVGIKRVTITVKDEKGATASASFDLTVVHVNHPPTDATIKYPLDGAKLKEGDAMWLDGTAKDSDKGDTLEYSWLDNGEPAGIGKNISVKLKPGKHTITLEVSDGSETVSTEIGVEVEKKETVTVAGGGNDWTMMAAAVAAAIAIVAVVAILAARRRKRPQEPEPSEEGRVSSVPEDETAALPPVPPAEAGPKGSGEEAQKVIDSTVDKLADYQEAHPDEAVDVAPVMEKLDIARDMLKSGEYDDALDFAREAEAAVDRITVPAAPKKVAVKKKKAMAAKDKDTTATKDKTASAARKCPGCGEELEGGWPVCPACGFKTA